MTEELGANDLHAWLIACARGLPPMDGMRNWFNDWWLQHPENTKGTPAYSDLPGASLEPFGSTVAQPRKRSRPLQVAKARPLGEAVTEE